MSSPRKSKRVAKKKEHEVYWLMHNFPQGLDPDDFTADREVFSNVNEKLKESESSVMMKASRRMPVILRSGRSIAATAASQSTSSSGSVREEPVSSGAESEGEERAEGGDGAAREDGAASEDGADSDATSPEQREQWERVERAKLPKFQSKPETICTRSGATYAFDWKKRGQSPTPSTSEPAERRSKRSRLLRPRVVPAPNKIVTRNTTKKQNTPPSAEPPVSKIAAKPAVKPAAKAASPSTSAATDSVTNNKLSTKSSGKSSSKSSAKPASKPPTKPTIKLSSKSSTPSTKSSAPSTKTSAPSTLIATPPVKPLAGGGKRMRLSLLPIRKREEDDEISAPLLGTLNIHQPLTPTSRPSSPASPVPSQTTPRRGRTASLNCKAVLSALMKPDLANRKAKKQPASPTSTVDKPLLSQNQQPDNFFKIRISTSYSQRVEFVHAGCATKLTVPSPQSIHEHETMILAAAEREAVKTNGWQWIGSHIDCISFVTSAAVRTTRLFFSAMERGGVELRVGDSVALKTGGATGERPFVGKIVAMWQDNLGEMMVTMCWFYRPADLENIRAPYGAHELYLTKHTDDNSVATIQGKVYVLSYPEYCRYYSYLVAGSRGTRAPEIVPDVHQWREEVVPVKGVQRDSIYFCRGVYDFRLRRTLKQQLYYTKYL